MPRLSAGLPIPVVLGAILPHACGTAAPAAMRSALDRVRTRPISESIARACEISHLPPAASPVAVTFDARSGAFLGAQGQVQERGR